MMVYTSKGCGELHIMAALTLGLMIFYSLILVFSPNY